MSSDLFGPPVDPQRRFRSLELTATASVDDVALRRIMERAAAAYRRRHRPDSARVYGPSGNATAETSHDHWSRHGWRIWWVPPMRWRDDIIWTGGQTAVIAVQPGVSLSYVSMHRTLYTGEPAAAATGLLDRFRPLFRATPAGAWPADSVHLSTVPERVAEFPLTNPRLPASAWDLTTLGEEEYLGRLVRRVRARRRAGAGEDDEVGISGYWPWLSEYECLVDDALGILLRLTGLADGVPVGAITADEVRVDASIAEEVFAFAPPADTRMVHVAPRS
jgi:hypothetical protein